MAGELCIGWELGALTHQRRVLFQRFYWNDRHSPIDLALSYANSVRLSVTLVSVTTPFNQLKQHCVVARPQYSS